MKYVFFFLCVCLWQCSGRIIVGQILAEALAQPGDPNIIVRLLLGRIFEK